VIDKRNYAKTGQVFGRAASGFRCGRLRGGAVECDVGEGGGFEVVGVVGADADADVDGVVQDDSGGGRGGFGAGADVEGELVAFALDAEVGDVVLGGGGVFGFAGGGGAVLEGDVAVVVDGGVGAEALAEELVPFRRRSGSEEPAGIEEANAGKLVLRTSYLKAPSSCLIYARYVLFFVLSIHDTEMSDDQGSFIPVFTGEAQAAVTIIINNHHN